jgi:DNA-binding transcriptional LysR family regulator
MIRVGPLEDSSMVARRIGTMKRLTCASPGYLERHGEPRGIDAKQFALEVNPDDARQMGFANFMIEPGARAAIREPVRTTDGDKPGWLVAVDTGRRVIFRSRA